MEGGAGRGREVGGFECVQMWASWPSGPEAGPCLPSPGPWQSAAHLPPYACPQMTIGHAGCAMCSHFAHFLWTVPGLATTNTHVG